jgi:hypothetical protein
VKEEFLELRPNGVLRCSHEVSADGIMFGSRTG